MVADRVSNRVEKRVASLNRALEQAWQRGFSTRPQLDHLLLRADRRAHELGEGGWREALDILVGSLQTEAALNPLGLTFAYAQLSRLLKQRQRAHHLWRTRPEIADQPIERPIIVLGHMRSGTTRLQRLLGCDPRLNHTRFYEITHPVAANPDFRVLESRLELAVLHWLNPSLQTIHPTAARDVEEVFGLFAPSFYGAQFEAQWRVPSFTRYWEGRSRIDVYREFKLLLQTIAWQRGASSAPFVLKAPQFMEDLADLLAVFPDARLICVSREPAESVASTASLVWNQMRVQSDEASQHWIGAEWLRKIARREATCARARVSHADTPQFDVTFAAMNADWRGEMHRIYNFLDLPLTTDVEVGMARYLRKAKAGGYRNHRYQAIDFGLTPEIMRKAVSPA